MDRCARRIKQLQKSATNLQPRRRRFDKRRKSFHLFLMLDEKSAALISPLGIRRLINIWKQWLIPALMSVVCSSTQSLWGEGYKSCVVNVDFCYYFVNVILKDPPSVCTYPLTFLCCLLFSVVLLPFSMNKVFLKRRRRRRRSMNSAFCLLMGRGRGETHVTLIQEMITQWAVSVSYRLWSHPWCSTVLGRLTGVSRYEH